MVAILQRFVCGRRLVQIETEPSVEVEKCALPQKGTDIESKVIGKVKVRPGYLILFEPEDGAKGTGDPLRLGLGGRRDLSDG
jgi:hypothetical protein